MNACSTSYNVLHKHYLALSLSSNNPYLYLAQIVAEPSIYLTWTFFSEQALYNLHAELADFFHLSADI